MCSWLSANIGTIIVVVILAAIVTMIIAKLIKDKKNGKSACGCGCSNCSMADACHNNKK